MDKKLVYVSGPYTHPDPIWNTSLAARIGTGLFKAGFIPFVPHLSMFWHSITPMDYEDWLEIDLAMISKFDFVFRFFGESKGADRECERAQELSIPIFYAGPLLTIDGDSIKKETAYRFVDWTHHL